MMTAFPAAAAVQPTRCGPEFVVPSDTTDSAAGASVARAPDGGFLVLWSGTHSPGDDSDSQSFQARRFDAFGAPIGGQFQVNTLTTGFQSRPRVVSTPDGFFVVWSSQTGLGGDTQQAIEARRLDTLGQPTGPELQVNDSSPVNQSGAQLSADPAGGVVVVWLSDDSAGSDTSSTSIQGRRFDAAGAPIGSKFQVNTFTDGVQREPAVASNDAGAFVVTWTNGEYDATIAARRYDATGDPDGDEFQVTAASSPSTYRSAIAGSPDGAFVIAWSEASDIRARRYDAAGQPLGADFQVNSFTPNIQYGPALARADDGSFTIAWTSWSTGGTDQSFTNVQMRRLDPNGVPIGADVQVNTSTKGRQEGPAIASLGGEDFVIVYSGYDQDSPTFQNHLWGQRFAVTCITTTTTSTSSTTLPTSLLPGKTLRLSAAKGRKHAGDVVLRLTSRDAAITAGRGAGSADDPTLHGGSVAVRLDGWDDDAAVALPAAGWRQIRNGWRYRGSEGSVTVKDGKRLDVSLVLDGVSLQSSDPTPIDVVLRLGEQQLCLAFQPGTATIKRHSIVAHDGAAPNACLTP
jgi:hypothetical protein